MKFTIAKAEFQRGLARIQTIVEKRNTMPILANVLLEVKGSRDVSQLDLAATDLEVGIRSTHPCEAAKPGGVTVSRRRSSSRSCASCPKSPFASTSRTTRISTLRCARAEFTLAGTTAEEYPTLPSITPEHTVTVQAAILSDMIERTMYAASSDETRYNLNGVYFERLAESGKLRMVATDGHRLAWVRPRARQRHLRASRRESSFPARASPS